MKAEDIWARLEAMKGEYEKWAIVARKLGMPRQHLFYCLKKRAITPKLLEAMGLEATYVRAK
jgi:hypothetical protein